MLGIVTKVLVKLTPIPASTGVYMAAFPTMDAASDVVTDIIAHGTLPAALEMVDNLTIQAVEPVYHAGYPMDAGAVLPRVCEQRLGEHGLALLRELCGTVHAGTRRKRLHCGPYRLVELVRLIA